MRRLATLFAVLVLLAACGGDSGPTLDHYAAAITAAVQADGDDDELEITPEEATCVGDGAAEAIGLDRLEEAGTPAEVEKLAEDDLSAFDLSDAVLVDVAALTVECVPSTVAQFAGRLEVDEATTECIEEEISGDDLVPFFAVGLAGDEPSGDDEEALTALIEPCLGGSGSGGRADYVAAMASVFVEGGEDGIPSDEQGACIAERAADVIGQQRAEAVGTPDDFAVAIRDDLSVLDLADDELVLIGEAYLECAPEAAPLVRDGFVVGTETTGEQAECIADAMGEPELAKVIALTLANDERPELLQDLQSVLQSCL